MTAEKESLESRYYLTAVRGASINFVQFFTQCIKQHTFKDVMAQHSAQLDRRSSPNIVSRTWTGNLQTQ